MGALGEPSGWSDRELRRRAEALRRRRAARGVQGAREPVGPLRPSARGLPRVDVRRAWRLLELPEGASMERAREAYRRLMEEFHPDRFLDDPERHRDAVRLARTLTAAWLALRERA